MKRLPEVNLLKRENLESSMGLYVVSWALTVGRWLVIVTEMVVIMAFAWRFQLDYKTNQLKEEIDDQVQLIEIQAKTEKQYRETVAKLNIVTQAQKQQKNLVGVLTEFGKRMPPSLAVNSITWDGSQLKVDGYSKTEDEISVLENNMRISQSFNNVVFNLV